MMHRPGIGLPVSHQFDHVFGALKEIVDTLVIRDIAQAPRAAKKVYGKSYHASGFINRQFAQTMTPALIEALKKEGVTQMSFDCGPSCLDVRPDPRENDSYRPENGSSVLRPDEIIAAAKERTVFIRDRFQGVLALENLDYHRGGAYEHVCDPVFISELLRELKVYFALDIAHLMVSSFAQGMRPLEYLRRLPLDLVKEVHLSHPEGDNDKHECPTEEEYIILDEVLKRGRPEFIVIEYYLDPDKIIGAYSRLHKYLGAHG